MKSTHESIEVSHNTHSGEELPGFLTPDLTLLIVTWLCFFALLAALSKYAWKPILAALDEREDNISKSLEDAKRIEKEMSELAQKQEELIEQATQESNKILEKGRKAASEARKVIERKAREESQIILENAKSEITKEVDKAKAQLKQDSVKIAVELAGKLIEENMDTNKNNEIINDYVKQI